MYLYDKVFWCREGVESWDDGIEDCGGQWASFHLHEYVEWHFWTSCWHCLLLMMMMMMMRRTRRVRVWLRLWPLSTYSSWASSENSLVKCHPELGSVRRNCAKKPQLLDKSPCIHTNGLVRRGVAELQNLHFPKNWHTHRVAGTTCHHEQLLTCVT